MPTDYEHATPYDVSTDKKVSSDELNRIRKIMAWKVWWPYRLKLIVVHSPSNVTAWVDSNSASSLEFAKREGEWTYEIARSHVTKAE